MIPSRLHVYFSRQELKVSWGFDYKLPSKFLFKLAMKIQCLLPSKFLVYSGLAMKPFPTSKRVKPKEKKTTPALTLTLR